MLELGAGAPRDTPAELGHAEAQIDVAVHVDELLVVAADSGERLATDEHARAGDRLRVARMQELEAMAAGVATVTELRDGTGLADLKTAGQQLRDGLARQAAAHGLAVHLTGPVQMPFLRFEDDASFATVDRWCSETISSGLYVHPWHNWFLSAAHTSADIDEALEVTDHAFEVIAAGR